MMGLGPAVTVLLVALTAIARASVIPSKTGKPGKYFRYR